ncbi:MAG: methyltransferase [Candidatus Binatia bacterium]
MPEPIYVQYGCGLSAPPGWRNFDASPTLRLQRLPVFGRLFLSGRLPRFPAAAEYGDILKGLPVQPGSVSGLYCSHVLEHLSLADFRVALRNSFALLRPGGIFRLVMPDLEALVQAYRDSSDPAACSTFIVESGLAADRRQSGPIAFLRSWLGNSLHRSLWDYKGVAGELANIGFIGIRRAAHGDSADTEFLEVEELERWQGALGVECRKG